jgi:hypothetical protein
MQLGEIMMTQAYVSAYDRGRFAESAPVRAALARAARR